MLIYTVAVTYVLLYHGQIITITASLYRLEEKDKGSSTPAIFVHKAEVAALKNSWENRTWVYDPITAVCYSVPYFTLCILEKKQNKVKAGNVWPSMMFDCLYRGRLD